MTNEPFLPEELQRSMAGAGTALAVVSSDFYLSPLIAAGGANGFRRFVEFFTVHNENENTREGYGRGTSHVSFHRSNGFRSSWSLYDPEFLALACLPDNDLFLLQVRCQLHIKSAAWKDKRTGFTALLHHV